MTNPDSLLGDLAFLSIPFLIAGGFSSPARKIMLRLQRSIRPLGNVMIIKKYLVLEMSTRLGFKTKIQTIIQNERIDFALANRVLLEFQN